MPTKKLSKIYLAGALTHSRGLKHVYQKIASLCEALDIDAYLPHLWGSDPAKNPDANPIDVWTINQRQISSSSLVIAYAGEPSTGVGQELEIARIANIDIILWWFKGEKVSRMPLGNPAVIAQIEAKSDDELLDNLVKLLKKRYEK